MDIERLAIPDVLVLKPKRHGDDRGFFSETYNRRALAEAGLALDFVQDNHAYSASRGTVRGIHFQTPPCAQAKLIRVVRGAIFDVAVDLRCGSPTYGKHVAAEISAESWNQIFIPIGFGHGLCTLEDHTEVIYKVTNHYSAENDCGILWSDPCLNIKWPISDNLIITSDKDKHQPTLSNLPSHFKY